MVFASLAYGKREFFYKIDFLFDSVGNVVSLIDVKKEGTIPTGDWTLVVWGPNEASYTQAKKIVDFAKLKGKPILAFIKEVDLPAIKRIKSFINSDYLEGKEQSVKDLILAFPTYVDLDDILQNEAFLKVAVPSVSRIDASGKILETSTSFVKPAESTEKSEVKVE